MSARWLLAQRPRSAAEIKKRGLTGRRLSREEIAAEAAKLGLPVYGASVEPQSATKPLRSISVRA
jgi:hypothetical protein